MPNVPVPSVLNLASPTKFLRIPSGPVASTPLARRLSATHTASVRNLKRSDSLSLQEVIKRHPVIINNDTRFFMIFDLSELAE